MKAQKQNIHILNAHISILDSSKLYDVCIKIEISDQINNIRNIEEIRNAS